VLCALQATTVLLPRRPRGHSLRSSLVGLAVPALALGTGVLVLRLVAGGPHALALLGAVATPVLAAARPRRAPVAAALWLVAWLVHGLVGQAAGVMLIALAAATVAEAAAAIAPAWSLALGLVVLCLVDVVLVWATPQVGPASNALHAAPLPVAAGRPIPRLGDATFGSATMGWLDFAAAALLGVIAARRLRGALATGAAAGLWGLLLVVTATVPATVPALAGLMCARLR
jgi:hypothetical protein